MKKKATPLPQAIEVEAPFDNNQMPLRNCRALGDLTHGQSEWWLSFGRHIAAAQRDMDKRQPLEPLYIFRPDLV